MTVLATDCCETRYIGSKSHGKGYSQTVISHEVALDYISTGLYFYLAVNMYTFNEMMEIDATLGSPSFQITP